MTLLWVAEHQGLLQAYEQPNFFVTQAKESEQKMMVFNNETS